MEVITMQSEAYLAIIGKIEAINTRLSTREKEPT